MLKIWICEKYLYIKKITKIITKNAGGGLVMAGAAKKPVAKKEAAKPAAKKAAPKGKK